MFYARVAAMTSMADAGIGGDTVGLVGDDDSVERAVESVAGTVVAGDAATVLAADPDVVVAVGKPALLAVARRRPAVPVLPVVAGVGIRSIRRDGVSTALHRRGSENWLTTKQPLVAVETPETSGTALFDAALVTAEPASISEYSLAADGDHLGTVRADGVVAATPAGTRGYADAVDTPVIPAGPDVFALAPIAPFETDPPSWVLPDEELAVTVEREGTPVTVLADDRTVAELDGEGSVEIARDGAIWTVVVPESAPRFARRGAELEKH